MHRVLPIFRCCCNIGLQIIGWLHLFVEPRHHLNRLLRHIWREAGALLDRFGLHVGVHIAAGVGRGRDRTSLDVTKGV